eukprot:SAG31_NODE_2009_length_6673_cov_3.370094_5_plen_166_part_00
MRKLLKIIGSVHSDFSGNDDDIDEEGLNPRETAAFYSMDGIEDDDAESEECAEELEEERRAYQRAMDDELAMTADSTLGHSFLRRPTVVPSDGAATRAAATRPHGDGGTAPRPETPSGPVDLDWNLVQNLLSGYSFEQGGGGPASSFAAILGASPTDGFRPAPTS